MKSKEYAWNLPQICPQCGIILDLHHPERHYRSRCIFTSPY